MAEFNPNPFKGEASIPHVPGGVQRHLAGVAGEGRLQRREQGPSNPFPAAARALSLTLSLSLHPPPLNPQVSLVMAMIPGKLFGLHYQHNRIK